MRPAIAPERASAWSVVARDRLLLLAAAATVGGLRLWMSWAARYPRVIADETAYLAMGRYLAGGPTWPLGRVATYQPLYGLLTVPWFFSGLSPDGVYRAAILTNAVLGVGLFLVLERLTRRLTLLERPMSVLVAGMAASLPALLMTSNFAWSDNLTPLVFVLVVSFAVQLTEAPTAPAAVRFGLVVVMAYSAHDRFLPLVAVALVCLWALRSRRRLSTSAAAWSSGVVLIGSLLVRATSAFVYSRLYSAGRISQTTRNLGRVLDGPALLESALGQLWCQTVATAGLVSIGVIVLARGFWTAARRLPRRGRGSPLAPGPAPVGLGVRPCEPATILVLVGLVGTSFLVSAGFWVRPWMADQLIYGRFNDAFAPVLVVLGLSALMAPGELRQRVTAGVAALGVCILGVLPTALAHRDLLVQPFNGFGILGVLAVDPAGTRDLAAVAGGAAAATVLIVDASLIAPSVRWRRAVVGTVAATMLVVGIVRADHWVGALTSPDPRSVTYIDQIVPAGSTVSLSREAGTRWAGSARPSTSPTSPSSTWMGLSGITRTNGSSCPRSQAACCARATGWPGWIRTRPSGCGSPTETFRIGWQTRAACSPPERSTPAMTTGRQCRSLTDRGWPTEN